jgi:hypothetical protein
LKNEPNCGLRRKSGVFFSCRIGPVMDFPYRFRLQFVRAFGDFASPCRGTALSSARFRGANNLETE